MAKHTPPVPPAMLFKEIIANQQQGQALLVLTQMRDTIKEKDRIVQRNKMI